MAEQCENCRFWKTWDESEPVKLTKREFWYRQLRHMYSIEQIEAFMQQLPDDMESLTFNPECDGDCRIHAPQIAVNRATDDDSDPCIGRWPFTNGNVWCGEWQPAAVSKPTESPAKLGTPWVVAEVIGLPTWGFKKIRMFARRAGVTPAAMADNIPLYDSAGVAAIP
jgi:hypothetical protein